MKPVNKCQVVIANNKADLASWCTLTLQLVFFIQYSRMTTHTPIILTAIPFLITPFALTIASVLIVPGYCWAT